MRRITHEVKQVRNEDLVILIRYEQTAK